MAASLPGAAPCPPVLLVCTNGRRDVCCAVRGRPVALDAGAAHPGRVWEASHTGGHRFAPTGILLPHGATLARLDAELAGAVVVASDADELPAAVLGPRHDRGCSALAPGAQAAESHVRHLLGERSLTAFTVTEVAAAPPAPSDTSAEAAVQGFTVAHRDGRTWDVRCEKRSAAAELPESCGKVAVHHVDWTPVVVS